LGKLRLKKSRAESRWKRGIIKNIRKSKNILKIGLWDQVK
jgi:hypothetical protein